MPTPHISAAAGEIAQTVLMPGDPLRAKFIAETFLSGAVQVTGVRGMLGFTGRYGGVPVTVMGSGMGMPSMGIYSYELYSVYGVEEIIRVGSAGAYSPNLALFDVLLATAAYSESSFARVQNGCESAVLRPGEELCARLRAAAARLHKPLHEGAVHSCDVFYSEETQGKPYWQRVRDEHGCLAVEMESFALFHNAAALGRRAACLLTVSDSFVTRQKATAQQRERAFTDMIEIALGAVEWSNRN